MSRRRWIALLGPPLLVAAVAVPGLAGGLAVRVGATSPVPPRAIAPCPSPVQSAGQHENPAVPGAWWRTEPTLDAAGALVGWTLRVGAPGVRAATLAIPAASTVTGPSGGRVVVASEDAPRAPGAAGSTARIIDVTSGCALEIHLRDRVARRAVADPSGAGVLAHLLDPDTRRDLGVWRIDADGRIAERLVEPLPDGLRAAAGMDRVWTTDLRLDAAGRRLAVQSCHPDACVTRVTDLGSGDVAVLLGDGHGAVVGFAGRELITWAACHGLPCPVVAWDMVGASLRTVASEVSGAALAADGRHLVVLRREPGGGRELMAIDLSTGSHRSLGTADSDALPLSGGAGMIAGLEVDGAAVAIFQSGRVPVLLSLEDAVLASPVREVLP